MNETALFVVFYPGISDFLPDFIKSVNTQDYKQFDIVVVNDGFSEIYIPSLFPHQKVIELRGRNSIAGNRELGINYIKKAQYKYLVLCDVDDSFSCNRISKSLKALEYYDIAVNDLNIVNNNNHIIMPDYFSKTITKNTKIDLDFILKKNILGFSNTALRIDKINICILPRDLKIIDWYFFTILLFVGFKVVFISQSLTNYRQHLNNLIGIKSCTVKDFKVKLNLKTTHFRYLSEFNNFFRKYLEGTMSLQNLTDTEISQLLSKHYKQNSFPVWWEVINEI